MIRLIDYYLVLKVAPNASKSQIKDAHRRVLAEINSKVIDSVITKQPTDLINTVNEAEQVLSHKDARQVFDKLREIYPDGTLIPGASAGPMIADGHSVESTSKTIAEPLNSQFFEAYFKHFIERGESEEAPPKEKIKQTPKVKDKKLSRNNKLAGVMVGLFMIALLLKLFFAEPTTPQLFNRFERATPFERVRLAELISKRSDVTDKGKGILLATLLDEREDVVVRGAVAQALAIVDGESKKTEEALITAVSSSHTFLRIHATTALGLIKNPTPEVAHTLYLALNDDNEQVRLAASTSIANKGSELIERDIATISASSEKIPEEAAEILDDDISIATAIEDLKDPTAIVKISAIRSLATEKEGQKKIVEELIPLLNDPESEVVVATAHALGTLQNEAAIWPLLSIMADQDEQVRLAVAAALAKMPEEKVKVALSEIPATSKEETAAETVALLENTSPSTPQLLSEPIPNSSNLPSLSLRTELKDDYRISQEELLTQIKIAQLSETKGELLLGSLDLAAEQLPAIPPSLASPKMELAMSALQNSPELSPQNEDIGLYPDINRLLGEATSIKTTEKIDLAKLTSLPAISPPLAEPIPAEPPSLATPRSLSGAIGALSSPEIKVAAEDKEQYPDIDRLLEESTAVKVGEQTTEKRQLASLSLATEPIPAIEPEKQKAVTEPVTTGLATPDQLLTMSWANSVKLARKQFGTENRKVSIENFLAHPNSKIQTIGCLVIAERGFATATELERVKSILRGNNPHLLAAAAWALAELPGSETPELEKRLGQLIQDKSYWVRLHAARALGRFGTPTALELLKQQSANS